MSNDAKYGRRASDAPPNHSIAPVANSHPATTPCKRRSETAEDVTITMMAALDAFTNGDIDIPEALTFARMGSTIFKGFEISRNGKRALRKGSRL